MIADRPAIAAELRHRPGLGGDRAHDGDDRGPRVSGSWRRAVRGGARCCPSTSPRCVLTVPLLGFHGFAAGVLQLDAADAVGRRMDDRVRPLRAAVRVPARDRAGEPVRRRRAEAADRTRSAPTRTPRGCATIVADALDDRSLELVFRADGATASWTRGVSRSPPRPRPTVARRASWAARTRRSRRSGTTRRSTPTPSWCARRARRSLLALENGRLEHELRPRRRARSVARARRGRRRRRAAPGPARPPRRRAAAAGRAPDQGGARAGARASDSEIAAQLAEVGHGLEDAVRELRDLAHGIHPPVLRDFGLRAALASAAQRSTPPAALVVDGIARYPNEVETAVYFCCLESLQNVAKHAGPTPAPEVRVAEQRRRAALRDRRRRRRLRRPRHGRGSGLANMNERVAALRRHADGRLADRPRDPGPRALVGGGSKSSYGPSCWPTCWAASSTGAAARTSAPPWVLHGWRGWRAAANRWPRSACHRRWSTALCLMRRAMPRWPSATPASSACMARYAPRCGPE